MNHDRDIPSEKVLFDAANALRGSVESAEYKHLALGLVFLKYVSDGFAARRKQLDALTRDPDSEWFTEDEAEREEILEERDEYRSENVFWVPREARWDALLALGSQPDLGVQLDRALDLVEKENPSLKGVLPKVYARAEMRPETLGKLVSTVARISSATTQRSRAMSWAASTSTSSRSSRGPKATAAASSTHRATSGWPATSGSATRCSKTNTRGSRPTSGSPTRL